MSPSPGHALVAHRPRTLLALLLALVAMAASVPAGATATASRGVPADRVVVLWEADVNDAHRAAVLAGYGRRGIPVGRVDTVEVGRTRTGQVARHLDARSEVVAAEPDRTITSVGLDSVDAVGPVHPVEPALVEALETADTPTEATDPPQAPRPDDPLFVQQWGLENTGQVLSGDGTPGTPGMDVRARGAWYRTRGTPEVTVAVIDSGIDLAHPDLRGAFWRNPGERRDGLDSDANGYLDDGNGWDFVTGRGVWADDPSSLPAERHGTQVAGVIAARADDGVGVTGIAPRVRIMPVRAFDEGASSGGAGQSDIATLVAALAYAADNGADLINASWESGTDSSVLAAAIADVGIPVVAAAGNRGLDLDVSGTAIPAGLDLPNLVAVTAIDPVGRRPAFATVGGSTIDLAAPGVGIVTTTAGGGHTVLSGSSLNGTSFSAPFVSGALALGRSHAPELADAELIDTLLWTTAAEPALLRRTTTGGRLDAQAFLAALARPVCGGTTTSAAERFRDVEELSVHAAAIGCLTELGVAEGYGDGIFRPAATVTRGETASFFARIVALADALPPDPSDAFADDHGSVHEPAIDVLAALGVLIGDDDGRVQPRATVTRGQVASMAVRAVAAIEDRERSPSRPWFPDAIGSVHADGVDVARDLGLVRGRERIRFDVEATTRRDQLASMLARTLDALARSEVDLAPVASEQG